MREFPSPRSGAACHDPRVGSPHSAFSPGARVLALVLVASVPGCGRIDYAPHDAASTDVGASIDASLDALLDPLADTALDAPSLPDASTDAGACGATIRWFLGPGDDTLSRAAHTPDGGLVLQGQFSTPALIDDLTAGRFLARVDGDTVRWQRSGSFLDVEGDADGVLVLEDDGAFHLTPMGTMDRSLGTAVGAIGGGEIAGRGTGAVVAVSNAGSLTWSGTGIMTTSGSSDVAIVVLDGSGAVLASAAGGDADNDTVFDVAGAADRFYVSGAANTRVFCMAPAGCSADDASFVLTLDGTPPQPLTFLGPDVVHVSAGLAVDASGNVYLVGASATTSASASGSLRWTTGPIVSGVAAYDASTDRVVVAGLLVRSTEFTGTTLSPLGTEPSLAVLWLDASTGALVRHEVLGDGTLGVGDLDVSATGEVVVVGSTNVPFGVCGAAGPAPAGGRDAFLVTFVP